jgi:Lipase (class 3)
MTSKPEDFELLQSRAQREDWSAREFSWTKAYVSAGLSRLAYDELRDVKAGLQSSSRAFIIPSTTYQQHINDIDNTGVVPTLSDLQPTLYNSSEQIITPDLVILIINLRNVVYLSLRGTLLSYQRFAESLADIATDINIAKAELVLGGDKVARLHRGFSGAVGECFDEVVKLLQYFHKAPLCITGHSLGGAMAAIFLARLSARPEYMERVLHTYTFGMPRYLAASPPVEIQKPFNIVNKLDLVPTMPPSWLGFQDSSINITIAEDASGISVTDNAVLEKSPSAAQLLSLSHHKIEMYLQRLRTLQPRDA